MTRRLDKTLADYIGIAISPVLIMTLVGSLLFFLVEVFYRGQYSGRMLWIFFWFTIAIVLIGRISIELGQERAGMYSAALAVAVFLAMGRFAGGSVVISLFLIGLVWWSAHKLVWDCTLIDETEDASGEGLMQTVGLEEKAVHTGEAEPEKPKEPEGVTSRDAKPLTWWERFVEPGRRPHAPGVWVVYFSLAALPLFGIGQWFIPREDVTSRRYAFLLLLVYVASGLGLLLLTSFLGLRRYLRQRHLEMPPAMAGLWIVIGCVLIIVLLGFAMLLPRPGAELEIAELPFSVGSHSQESSRYAVMKGDPAEKDQGGPRSGTSEDAQTPGAGSQGQQPGRGGQSESKQGEPQPGSQREDSGSQAGAQGETGGSSTQEDARGGSRGDAEGEKRTPSSQAEQQPGSSTPGEEGQHGRPDADSQAGQTRSESSSREEGRGAQPGSEAGDQDAHSAQHPEDPSRDVKREQDPSARRSEPESEKDRGGSRSGKAGQKRERESGPSRRGAWREPDRPSDEPGEPESQTAENRQLRGEPNQQSWFDPQALLGGVSRSIATLFKWVMIGILLLVIGYWAWRSRAELLESLRNFFEGWRDFWQRLFGAKRDVAGDAASADGGPPGLPARSFAEFPDPFASGMADRSPPDELVRYSFEALEAWARDHGWARETDQTPHEFAHELGTRVGSLDRHFRRLADLYCRVAYAPGTLSPGSVAPLKPLWRELRHREPVSV